MKNCVIFNKNGNYSNDCYVCGCNLSEHGHLKKEYKPVQKCVIDPEKQKELNELLDSKKDSDNISKKIIEALENTICELRQEMDCIQKIAACFGYLLNKHSNSVNFSFKFYFVLIKFFSDC